MGKNLDPIILFLKIWAALSPFLGAVYLVSWFLQIANEDLFIEIDLIIGWLPTIFDSIMYSSIELYGEEYTFGYIQCAAVLVMTTILSMNLEQKLSKKKIADEEKEIEKRAQKALTSYKQEENKRTAPIENINHFYGLFELKLEYYNPMEKSLEDLEKLKKEYLRMIVEKLQSKYSTVKFSVSDKVFFYSDRFAIFNSLSDDFIKLYQIFYDLDYDKSIKTDLLLCFWSDYKKVDIKTGLKITQKINVLNYWNKVVVADKFPLRYKLEQNKIYDVVPLGPARLDMKNSDGHDMEIDLFYVKKL